MTTTVKKSKKSTPQLPLEESGREVVAPNVSLVSVHPANDGNIKKEQVLALDVATETGFATTTASGTWNFTPKKDESKGMRLIRFRAKVIEMITINKIKMVVFEAAAIQGKFPNLVGVELIGVLKLACEEMGCDYMAYQPASIKKWATGNGHAKKDLMVATAQKRWGMTGKNDNEADALAILHYALDDLNLVKKETLI